MGSKSGELSQDIALVSLIPSKPPRLHFTDGDNHIQQSQPWYLPATASFPSFPLCPGFKSSLLLRGLLSMRLTELCHHLLLH